MLNVNFVFKYERKNSPHDKTRFKHRDTAIHDGTKYSLSIVYLLIKYANSAVFERYITLVVITAMFTVFGCWCLKSFLYKEVLQWDRCRVRTCVNKAYTNALLDKS